MKILAVKPATKHLGIAVLDDKDLVYWKIKTLRYKKIPLSQAVKKLETIINELIDFWDPQVMAIEDIFYIQAKASPLLNTLVREIEVIGKSRGVNVCFYPPPSVRKFICQSEKPIRMNIARILAVNYYPWLYGDYEDERAKFWWEIKHKLRIFDAVAVGLFCHKELKEKAPETRN